MKTPCFSYIKGLLDPNITTGFLGGTNKGGKESTCQCMRHKRHGFDPWVGKILWSRDQQPLFAFLPGESHGQGTLVGYRLWGRRGRHG